jgi:hypothetical protein
MLSLREPHTIMHTINVPNVSQMCPKCVPFCPTSVPTPLGRKWLARSNGERGYLNLGEPTVADKISDKSHAAVRCCALPSPRPSLVQMVIVASYSKNAQDLPALNPNRRHTLSTSPHCASCAALLLTVLTFRFRLGNAHCPKCGKPTSTVIGACHGLSSGVSVFCTETRHFFWVIGMLFENGREI